MKIDRALLDRYMQLDREIQQCEGTRPNSLKNIEMKKNQAKDLEATIQELALHYQHCVQSLYVLAFCFEVLFSQLFFFCSVMFCNL